MTVSIPVTRGMGSDFVKLTLLRKEGLALPVGRRRIEDTHTQIHKKKIHKSHASDGWATASWRS